MGGAATTAAITFVGKLMGGSAVGAAITAAVVTWAVSKLAERLSRNNIDNTSDFGSGRTQTFREAAAPRHIIYGESRVGGNISYFDVTDDKRYLHLVISFAGHEVEEIGDIWLDDKVAIQADGTTASKYTDFSVAKTATVEADGKITYSGDFDDAPSPDTIIVIDGFSNAVNNGAHRIQSSVWLAETNTVEIEVETGGLVEETTSITITSHFFHVNRHNGSEDQTADTDLVRLSENWTDDHRGRGVAYIYVRFRWNRDKWPTGLPNVTAVVKGKRVFDPRDSSTKWTDNAALCAADYLADDLYGYGAEYSTEIADDELIAAANACDEQVDLAGGGTEVRYTINGRFTTDAEPARNLDRMTQSMAGDLIFSGGRWLFHAGVWRPPEIEIDESDMRGPLAISTKLSAQNRVNAVKGTFIGPANDWIEAGFPAVRNAMYESQDNDEVHWRNLSLNYTDSPSMAQRIAKILLEESRQEITVEVPTTLKVVQLRAGDNVEVTNSRMGWNKKPFRVDEWVFDFDQDADGAPILATQLILRETASGIFDWNSGEETQIDLAPDTNLPDPTVVGPPQNMAVASGTDQLYRKKDGTVVSRARITWEPPADGFVDSYEVQAKRSDADQWEPEGRPDVDDRQIYIWDVEDDEDYDFRMRSINPYLTHSPWVTITGHTIIGKTERPPDVQNFNAQQNRELVTFKWLRVQVNDIAGYEIRYKAPAAYTWNGANLVTRETRGTLVTNAAIPPGTWTVAIKAIDTSGNYSINATTTQITVVNEFNILESTAEHPTWPGVIETEANGGLLTESGDTLTTESGDALAIEIPSAVIHEVSGRLVPNSKSTAEGDNYDVFDTFVLDPVDELRYTAREIDIDFDEQVRAWADIEANLGPGEEGSADPEFYLDHHKEGESYDGFESWAIGTVEARFFKGQVRVPTAGGVGYLEEFSVTADLQERTERFEDFSVGASGSTLSYNNQFHLNPNIGIQVANDALFPIYRNKSTTQVEIELYDGSGTQQAGTVDVTVTGV